MYVQLNKLAVDINYGEGNYSTESYSYDTSTGVQNDSYLPNTGQDVLAVTGLGLVLVAVSLFAILRRKKPRGLPKAKN